jgi:peptidoglycan/LPS O-acetylase OafA/YrhL
LKLNSLQILRALAANGVLVCHLVSVERKYGHGFVVLPDLSRLGGCGVDLFFVISGFIMVGAAAGTTWQNFLLARLTRVFPPYWFYTTIVLLVSLAEPQMVNNVYDHPASIWKSYFLLPDTEGPLLIVGWTLIHEIYFYIGITLIIAFARRMMPSLIMWAGAVIVAHSLFPQLLVQATAPVMTVIFHPLTIEFVFGAMAGLILKSGRTRFALPSLVLGVGAVVYVLGTVFVDQDLPDDVANWDRVTLLGIPFAMIVYGCASIEVKRDAFRTNIAVRLGDASYSTYLAHVLVMSGIGRVFFLIPLQSQSLEVAMLGVCLAMCNAVGLLSYRFIEQPTIRFARQVLSNPVFSRVERQPWFPL